jgi:hypothetical protein
MRNKRCPRLIHIKAHPPPLGYQGNMFHLRRDILLAVLVKLVLLYGIKTAFFSEEHRVTVDADGLNRHLGLPARVASLSHPGNSEK